MSGILLAFTVFLSRPCLYDMPEASAYTFSRSGSVCGFEDRYDVVDLWLARSMLGCWEDDDGRCFELYALETLPPPFSEKKTRSEFVKGLVNIGRRDEERRLSAVKELLPSTCIPSPERLRQLPKGCRDFIYFPSTNETQIAAAFLPKRSSMWYMAVWILAPGDDYRSRMDEFSEGIAESMDTLYSVLPPHVPKGADERTLMRLDVRHSVTNHPGWHCTEAEEFSILDNLPSSRTFISTLTNDLSRMRARFAQVIPSPLECTNTLCVARIYSTRSEYVRAAGEEMAWSAAYWNPQRRELVAHLPPAGEGELLKTMRHESFHQYLSYVSAMASASPWFNEGYAQYFEDEKKSAWSVTEEEIEEYAKILPALFHFDYPEFYAGTPAERSLKYRLAWSIAYFIEHGAPKVRFEPFAKLKKLYMETLVETRDMHKATASAFETKEKFVDFVAEWRKFWLKR